MSDGLGAGFASLTLLLVLGGLAVLVALLTAILYAFHRRSGRIPDPLQYLLVAVSVVVLGVSGFAVLALYDEAPTAAGIFGLTVLVPLLVVGAYLERTTGLGSVPLVTTTVMAWGLTFVLGVAIVFGVLIGINALFDLAPVQSRRMGIPWIASTVGGLSMILGMVVLCGRLSGLLDATPVGEAA